MIAVLFVSAAIASAPSPIVLTPAAPAPRNTYWQEHQTPDWSLDCPDHPGEVEIFVSSEYREITAGLINLWTGSTWATHTGFVTCDGRVIDATPWFGVAVHSKLPAITRHYYRVKAVPLLVEAFLDAQMGKPYNVTGLVSFPLGDIASLPGTWFCSQLVQAAVLAGGADLTGKSPKRSSPAAISRSRLLQPIDGP